MSKFKASRANGKSDAVVLAERIEKAKPDDIFSYEDLVELLEEGTDRTLVLDRIPSIVASARKTILQETERALINVRGVGYRVAEAKEHAGVSTKHKDKAFNQLRISMDTLTYTKVNEMTEEECRKHSERLVKTGKLINVLAGHESRVAEVEQAIDQIRGVLVDAKKRGKL